MAWEARKWIRPFGKRLVAVVEWIDPRTKDVPTERTYRWQVLYVSTGIEIEHGYCLSPQAAQAAAEKFLSELLAAAEVANGR